MKRFCYLFLFIALPALFGSVPVLGQEPSVGVDPLSVMGEPKGTALSGATLDWRTEELTSLMRCPVCQGLSIADSGTAIAMAMKEEVRQFLAAGYTDDQILSYFESSYGEFIRLEPKPTGFNLLVWIAPIAALIIGFFFVIHRLRSAPPAAEESPDSVEQEDLDLYRERVRREVIS